MLVSQSCPAQLFAIPWTVAHKALLSMKFSRQEYRSELPFLFPGDLPDPGVKLTSPMLQGDPLSSELPGKPSYYNNLTAKIRSLNHAGLVVKCAL